MTSSGAISVRDLYRATDELWSLLYHVYALVSGKGGVGKTTTAANLSVWLASQHGLRVLVVDLNKQGNISRDLGYRGSAIDDRGRGLFTALTTGSKLEPARGVRENLDIIPGGAYLQRIDRTTIGDPEAGHDPLLTLAVGLAAIADRYDAIIIDVPPENAFIARLALTASRFAVVAAKTDGASTGDALLDLAQNFARARALNPYLLVLGVFLFATTRNAIGVHGRAREKITEALADVDGVKMFDSVIGSSEAAAQRCRDEGLVFAEMLEADQLAKPERAEVASPLSRLVEDFNALNSEIVRRSLELKAKQMERNLWP